MNLYLLPFLILQWRDSSNRALASSVARLQIFLSCTNFLHPRIFIMFTVWSVSSLYGQHVHYMVRMFTISSVCSLYGQYVRSMKGMFCLVMARTWRLCKKTQIACTGISQTAASFSNCFRHQVHLNECVTSRLVTS